MSQDSLLTSGQEGEPQPLLAVDDLRTCFRTEEGVARAVDGISYNIRVGETFSLVGESGCGKSVSAMSILRLVPDPPGRIESGRILFKGRDLLRLSEEEMRQVRGNEIAMIFQEVMTSLNPVFTIGAQIVEAVVVHQGLRAKPATDRAVEVLRQVGMPEPQRRIHDYPHQLSGGLRQRAMIAMALACAPSLLIADEPTTALDVTIQAQILDLLKELQRQRGLSVLLITHDLSVVAENAERVAVMYAGRIMESADVGELFREPLHPYTEGLFACIPRLDAERKPLETIPGSVPDPLHFPAGCRFHPRCRRCGNDSRCLTLEPPLREVALDHWVACWKTRGYEQAPTTTPNSKFRR